MTFAGIPSAQQPYNDEIDHFIIRGLKFHLHLDALASGSYIHDSHHYHNKMIPNLSIHPY